MLVTVGILKCDKLSDSNSKQLPNISFILLIDDVSKFIKLISLSIPQYSNIPSAFTTKDELKLDKSTEIIYLQLSSTEPLKKCSKLLKLLKKYFYSDEIRNYIQFL